MSKKVDNSEIDKLKGHVIKESPKVDALDAFDRATGKVLSRIGKAFLEVLQGK